MTAPNPCKLQQFLHFLKQFFVLMNVKNARCFHMFLAFFDKKQFCRLKLDDSVTRKKAGGRRRTEAFTHRGFYTEKPLHRGVCLHTEGFTQRSLYSKELLRANVLEFLHTETVTQRSLYTESFNAQTCLHAETFAQRSLCTESFYTRKPLHTEKSLHRRAFTQRNFHTQKETFTQRSLYTE